MVYCECCDNQKCHRLSNIPWGQNREDKQIHLHAPIKSPQNKYRKIKFWMYIETIWFNNYPCYLDISPSITFLWSRLCHTAQDSLKLASLSRKDSWGFWSSCLCLLILWLQAWASIPDFAGLGNWTWGFAQSRQKLSTAVIHRHFRCWQNQNTESWKVHGVAPSTVFT